MTTSKTNIVLTGFMGTGKSVVGKILSKSLQRKLVDTDKIISERFKKTIPEIFDQLGEAAFRNAEKELCQELSLKNNLVIATGGGTLIPLTNLKTLEKNATVFCLNASLENILNRISHKTHRPLFHKNTISQLLNDRQSAYARIFHQIDTNVLEPKEVATLIEKICVQDEEFLKHTLFVKPPSLNPYPILIKDNIFSQIGNVLKWLNLPSKRIAIVVNKTVFKLHSAQISTRLKEQGFETFCIQINDGESHKNLNTVHFIYQQLLTHQISRKDTILVLGGGVTGDIAGFVAATYLRGVNLIQLPTTLLSMVDSSVGGKTGVDLEEGKNLIGAFKNPSAVVIDPLVLKTLPTLELASGFAEIVKHSLIESEDFFSWLEDFSPKSKIFEELIKRTIQIKINIVEEDPYEQGRRAVLNLGHTFAHAFELVSNFKLAHGQAVAIGLVAACHLSHLLSISREDLSPRISKILQKFNLPISFVTSASPEKILNAMQYDKKRQNNKLQFILPKAIGEVNIHKISDQKLILKAIELVCL